MDYKDIPKQDIKPFLKTSNLKGFWLLWFNWGLIVLAFVLPALWLNAMTIAVSLIILANRQLGIAILMHECSHYSLFRSRKLNQYLGQMLCAAPILADINGYRRYHMQHHKRAGTISDPDYPNYRSYPVNSNSLLRKTIRDFSGLTGIKTLYAILLMHSGILNYDMSYQSNTRDKSLRVNDIIVNLCKNLALPVLTNTIIWGLLYLSGHGYLYLLWWASYITVYMFFSRIRNAAEHGNVPNLLDKNPLLHARTTYASWWERLSFAPNYVNYHVEHHLQANVPSYNLPAFHTFLTHKGVLEHVNVSGGYIDVIKLLIGKKQLCK